MSYSDDETSQGDGDVVELYLFEGAASTWRYTSGIDTVTFDGDDYAPLAGLARGPVSAVVTADVRPLSVTLPIAAQVVAHYAFATPPRSLHLTVTRVQQNSGDARQIWNGDVVSIRPRGLVAEMSVPSLLGQRLSTNLPSLSVRNHCLHGLYDARCRVARADFDLTTTVNAINATDGRIVTVSDVGGNPDDWFRAGEIVRDADGERRGIVSQIGAVLKLVSPFRELANGNAVTLYAGCDHTIDACKDKFDNLVNFGGFATIPKYDPFRVPLRLGGG